MEVPPESFEMTTSHTIELLDSGKACDFDGSFSAKVKGGYIVDQGVAHKINIYLSQDQKSFRLCKAGKLTLGNIRLAGQGPNAKAIEGSDWTLLPVIKQYRAKDDTAAWVVEASLNDLPKALQKPDALGKVFELDLKFELPDFERIGELEEPLTAVHPMTIKVLKGAASSIVDDPMRVKRLAQASDMQEMYLGQFEVTDSAVNDAMRQMRESVAVDVGAAKDIIASLDKQIDLLKQEYMEEMSRQFESLAAKAQPAGFDLAPNLKLWQLPAELIGLADASDDVATLKRRVAQLEAMVKERDAEIARLKGGGSAAAAAGSGAKAVQALNK